MTGSRATQCTFPRASFVTQSLRNRRLLKWRIQPFVIFSIERRFADARCCLSPSFTDDTRTRNDNAIRLDDEVDGIHKAESRYRWLRQNDSTRVPDFLNCSFHSIHCTIQGKFSYGRFGSGVKLERRAVVVGKSTFAPRTSWRSPGRATCLEPKAIRKLAGPCSHSSPRARPPTRNGRSVAHRRASLRHMILRCRRASAMREDPYPPT
jgi:hypothetical protein